MGHNIKLAVEIHDLQARLAASEARCALAERALISKGYYQSCDIPACNCGDQWTHGGHAEARLREISDALPYENGKTLLQQVPQLATLTEAVKGYVEAKVLFDEHRMDHDDDETDAYKERYRALVKAECRLLALRAEMGG